MTISGENADMGVDDEDLDDAAMAAMVSSSRRRINGWLPMFINIQHWNVLS